MRRKLSTLLLFFALTTVPVDAGTTHYFQQGSPDNTLPCTQVDPCDNFPGTTLDNNGALGTDDWLRFKRGDEWVGSEAQVRPETAGTSGHPINIGAWSTGTNPIFASAAVTAAGWSVHSGSIYKISGQSQSRLKSVTQNDNKAMVWWTGTNTTLPEGTFRREGSTLYVHLWGDLNPASNNVRIANYTHFDAEGGRGLVGDSDTVSRAHYHNYRDLRIINTNGVGFSFGGTGGNSIGLYIMGAGMDGWLAYYIVGAGGQAQYTTDYFSEISYSAATMGNGTAGQGVTIYGGPYAFFIGTYAHDNFMAGIDFLDFSSNTNVTESGIRYCRIFNNGISQNNPSYDPNFYSDGASEIWADSNEIGYIGLGSGTAGNDRANVKFGSEHPTSKPTKNHYFIGNLVYGGNWVNLQTAYICYNSTTECPPSGDSTPPQTIENTVIVGNTFMGVIGSAGQDQNILLEDALQTEGSFIMRNNLFIITAGEKNSYYMDEGVYLDADYNGYFVSGSSSSSTAIYSACDGCGGTSRNLTQWTAATGEDAHSVYGDPLVGSYSNTTPDPTLGNGSPMRDAGMVSPFTVPAWLPQEIKDDIGPAGFRGTTKSDGTLDDVTVAPDIGYHKKYANFTSVTCTPASLTQDVVTSLTCSFTMPPRVTALLYNWSMELTLPTGFVISSGATSAMTSSNITGSWNACTVSGQTITCARTGDGDSELPGSYSVTVSSVKNPHATGPTGTFALRSKNASGTKIAENTTISGVSISSAASAVCGNSIIETGETCDDGNTTALDGCSATCQTETHTCGNLIVEYTEQCDDGNTTALDGCSATCQIESPVCGNGVIESGETCDDSNATSNDGCSSSCLIESTGAHFSCGKGVFSKGGVS